MVGNILNLFCDLGGHSLDDCWMRDGHHMSLHICNMSLNVTSATFAFHGNLERRGQK
ncbi:hypothetical protein HGM15179_003785, partial [Zosterops borbonicus]